MWAGLGMREIPAHKGKFLWESPTGLEFTLHGWTFVDEESGPGKSESGVSTCARATGLITFVVTYHTTELSLKESPVIWHVVLK